MASRYGDLDGNPLTVKAKLRGFKARDGSGE
jgi:hypothetical protein